MEVIKPNMSAKKVIFFILIATMAIALTYSFFHKGLKGPLKQVIGQTENGRLGGDFWSTFPAPFVEKYNPTLRDKTIVKNWYKDPDWGYGPIQHLVTLPLTPIKSIRVAAFSWLMCNYIFLALSIFLIMKVLSGAPFLARITIICMWIGFWPLHYGLEEGVIEVFELFLITAALYFMCKKKDIACGIVLGIASMAKFLPIIFLLYFAVKRQWRAFFAMLVTIFIIIIGTQFTLGWQNSEMTRRFFAEIRKGELNYTYWRSQTIPSAVERIFSTSDYSTSGIYSPKIVNPAAVKTIVRITIPALLLFTFLSIYGKRKSLHYEIEFGIIALLMFIMSPHGEHYYLIFSLIGFSVATLFVFKGRRGLWTALLILSYFLSGYIMQMREFDRILLPDFTNINREIFFSFLSFPLYGVVLLFILLFLIYYQARSDESRV